MLVRFKLQVYFAMYECKRSKTSKSMEGFADFLRENGADYAKFPELAPYFALPYIINNPDHYLVVDIRKVLEATFLYEIFMNLDWLIQDEWARMLELEWKDVLKTMIHHNHGFDERLIKRQLRSHASLKEKFLKLKKDHKLLLGIEVIFRKEKCFDYLMLYEKV